MLHENLTVLQHYRLLKQTRVRLWRRCLLNWIKGVDVIGHEAGSAPPMVVMDPTFIYPGGETAPARKKPTSTPACPDHTESDTPLLSDSWALISASLHRFQVTVVEKRILQPDEILHIQQLSQV